MEEFREDELRVESWVTRVIVAVGSMIRDERRVVWKGVTDRGGLASATKGEDGKGRDERQKSKDLR